MVFERRRALLGATTVAATFLLAGCSGGSGGGAPPVSSTPTPTPAPTPTPTPTPAPTPTPTPSSYDTAEYRATIGAVSMNALTAYNHGGTGLGITVGIIDSGIDLNSQEFGTRISPASTYLAGTGTVQDPDGHGTAVAFTLAGRRNGTGTHGVAFDATLLILRTDDPGSCASSGGCAHDDNNIAAALDVARTNGARVVNISLGGSPPSTALVNAINRATSAGIVIVISAGNDGTAQPDPLAQIAENDAVARNLVIIAGSIKSDGTDTLSTFSNQAGAGATHYLAAVGEDVRAPNNNNVPFIWSGTSFSAPQISGAVALLAQAFPTLTGAQIVDILYQSARDAGATGTDAIYGRGVLDLTRAFQPLGSTSVAGTAATVSFTDNGTLSTPMGDAGQSGLGAVILDGFGRAFAIDLANTLHRAAPTPELTNALAYDKKAYAYQIGRTAVAVTIAPGHDDTRVSRLLLSPDDADHARTLAASVTSRLDSKSSFAIGFAEGGATLGARLADAPEPAFLIARDPSREMGFTSTTAASFAFRHQIGRWGLTATAETGSVLNPRDNAFTALSRRDTQTGYGRVSLGIDRRVGPTIANVTFSNLTETGTVLGARFGDALGNAQASSWFVDAGLRVAPGHGWTLGASMRQGWTLANVRAGLAGSGLIRTNGFAADIGKQGVFSSADRVGLRFSQPLRVASGGIDLALPTGYDYSTTSVDTYTTQRLNLAPTGREIDMELGYARALWLGELQTNFYWRRNPGNFASLPDDYGLALRYGFPF